MTNPETLRAEQLPELNVILENMDRLTEEILQQEADRMIEEAQAHLRRASRDNTTVDASAEAPSEERLDPLTALGEASNALGVEVGNDAGITHMLARDVHPDPEIRAAAKQQRQRIQAASDGIYSDAKYEELYQDLLTMDPATLSPEDQQRREYHIQRFQQTRQEASSEAGDDMRSKRELLSATAEKFLETAANAVTLQLSPEEFASLPSDAKGQLEATLIDDQYIVELDRGKLNYILENGDRGFRQRAYETFFGARVEDNDERLRQMAQLRKDIAGEGKTWTDTQVEGRMLQTGEQAAAFVEGAKGGIVERYKATVTKLQDLLRKEDPTADIAEWDLPYLMKKLTAEVNEKFDASQVTFTLEKTLRGLMSMAEKMLAIKVEEASDIPGWAPGVRAYRVFDAKNTPEDGSRGENLGIIFVDPLQRDKKRENPANYAVRYGLAKEVDGQKQTVQLPISVTVAGFTGPSKVKEVGPDGTEIEVDVEAKMTLRQVETLGHELAGHALNVTLARNTGPEFGGEKLKDGMETVSMALERVVKDPKLLLLLADDAENIPDDVKQAFIAKRRALQGHADALLDMRTLRATVFDLALHNSQEPNVDAAIEEVQRLMEPVRTDGTWARAQVHYGNPYAGRYGNEYMAPVETSNGIARWLQLADYSADAGVVFAQVGSPFREILELGGHPDTRVKLLALAARTKTTQGVGSLVTPREQP